MNKSKLSGFIIDCKTDNLENAVNFWSAALGMPKQDLPSDADDKYMQLIDNTSELHIEVQSVEHPSRVHLDIETDNVEAEVERLKKLGAKVVNHINTWCVMEAPTGQRFCVVQQSSPSFEQMANTWE